MSKDSILSCGVNNMRILLLESDHQTESSVANHLRHAGFAIDHTEDAVSGLNMSEVYPYDACIHILSQSENMQKSLDFVQDLRNNRNFLPVILISPQSSVVDLIKAFNHGIDEYLIEPVNKLELEARLHALLRRSRMLTTNVLDCGNFYIDFTSRLVRSGGKIIRLTAKEYRVLELFTSNPGRIFTRQEIIERVWDENFNAMTNIVDVYVKNLRRKLGNQYFETVRGLGYRLMFPQAA